MVQIIAALRLHSVALGVLLLFTASAALAQGPSGEITGLVTDTSGAVVPGASISVENAATGAIRQVTTNEAGRYSIPALLPGTYSVTTEKPGFQKQVRSNLLLQVQQIARVDFSLSVGEVTQTLEVVGLAPQLSTEDATVGQVIENRRIVELPLNGRNYLQLTALSPGVNINSSPSGGGTSFQGGHRASQSVTINGQRGQFNHFTLDGIENTDPNFNTYILLPSIDALQEFKVQSATYPAEFGYAVSQINVTTKSGGNDMHGSVFEFLRNAQLDAKNFFDKPKDKIPPFRRNQFGGTLGGPIVKNRLFYFGNYEGLRQDKAITGLRTVPTAERRAGNFAGLRAIYDPLTRVRGADGKITAQQFAGNVVPVERISQISKTAMDEFWPEPNLGGTVQNYLTNEPRKFNTDQFTTRVDFQQSSNLSLYARYSYTKDREYQPGSFPNTGTWTRTRADQLLAGATKILSASLVSDTRFGWSRFDNKMIGVNSYERDVNGEVLKIPGVNLSNDPAFWGIPAFGITGYSGFSDRTHIYITHNNLFEGQENLSWVRGRHMMKFGGVIKPIHYNQLGNQFALGGFDFDGSSTVDPTNRSKTGEPMADFLLGMPIQAYTAVKAADARLRSIYWAGYFSDSFKVTPKLTFDFGIRYEYIQPFKDLNDMAVNVWGLGTDNPILVRASNAGTGRDPYEDQFVRFTRAEIVRDGRMGPGLVRPDRNNWAPRLGLAYTVSGNTVIRAGFGVFYNMIDLGNSIYDMNRTLAGLRRDYSNESFPDLTLDNPYRTGASGGTVPLPQPLILANNPDTRNSYVEQWTLDVQHTVRENLLIDVAYVGSQTHRLKKITGWNNPSPGPGSIDARRPYQQFGWIQYPDSIGNGNYHALQVKVEQRFTKGLTVLGAYTFGKSIDDTSGVRPGSGDPLFVNNPWVNNAPERARSGFDVRHRWVTSTLYELPFGRGKKFLGSAGGFSQAVLGGWQIGSIVTLESGLPVTPFVGRDVSNVGVGADHRPNATGINPNLGRGEQSVSRFFNTAAFVEQAAYTFGNAGRNVVEAPGIINLDMSVMKRFPLLAESRYMEFRGEIFNAPNHPIFGMPTTTLRSSTYGQLTGTKIDSRQIQLALRLVF